MEKLLFRFRHFGSSRQCTSKQKGFFYFRLLGRESMFHPTFWNLARQRSASLVKPVCQPALATNSDRYKIPQNMAMARSSSTSEKNCYIIDTEHDREQNLVTVVWNNLSVSQYPLEFLRDNCQCAHCLQCSSGHRLVGILEAVKVAENPETSIDVSDYGAELIIKWGDGHESYFNTVWLSKYCFPAAGEPVSARASSQKSTTLWSSQLNGHIPSIMFADVFESDSHLYEWMELLDSYGLCILKGAPKKPKQIPKLAERSVGYLRKTCYGDVLTIRSKPNASNVAYTAEYLPLHTDLPYYKYQPGIQVLHCIEQSVGSEGVSHLADGFKVAEDFKRKSPEAFNLLAAVNFLFRDIGTDKYGDYHLEAEGPIIGLDQHNEVESIRHNNTVRICPLDVNVETLRKVYRAYSEIVKLMYDPRNLVEYKMEEGDMVCFNNQRVLHGRTAYDTDKVDRWLEGGYLDWDDLHSKMRVLKRKLNKDV